MKKISKILAIVLSLILVLITLTACGDETVNEAENKTVAEEIARGVIDENNVYTSEFADITFKLPDGWVFSTDEQIASMMNVGVDILEDQKDNVAEIIEQTALYDMVANDQTNGTSVMVMFEKPLLNVNEEYYLNNVKEGLEAVTEFNYEVSDEITTETVGGQEYKTLSAKVPEYNMVQKYYAVKKGDYFVDIIITYMEGVTDLETILSNFQ